mgnify:CR=1 FL=1
MVRHCDECGIRPARYAVRRLGSLAGIAGPVLVCKQHAAQYRALPDWYAVERLGAVPNIRG